MQGKLPKNDSRFEWTHHVVEKMRYYGLSEGRVRRVIHSPKRIEEGVAPGTTAVMQPSTTAKNRYEVWVMYQIVNPESRNLKHKTNTAKPKLHDSRFKFHASRKRIITAWRYPGVSKPRAPIPVPEEIMAELEKGFQ